MKRSEAIKHGLVAFVGYLLSPLSWWNDIYVNIPLAYIMATPFAFWDKKWFPTIFLAAYWLTNLTGLVLLHWGVQPAGARPEKSAKRIASDIAVALLYTTIMVVLIRYGYLKSPTEYIH